MRDKKVLFIGLNYDQIPYLKEKGRFKEADLRSRVQKLAELSLRWKSLEDKLVIWLLKKLFSKKE